MSTDPPARMEDPRFDQALRDVETKIAEGSGAHVLDALLAAWRIRRSPLLTDAIEALSARFQTVVPKIEGKTERHRYEQFLDLVAKRRSVDVARIVGELPRASIIRARDHIERVAVMDPDPRIARALLDHVATRRYNLFHKIWTGIFRELRRNADQRIREALAALPLPDDEVSGGNNLRARIQYALDHIPVPSPDSDDERRRLEAVHAAIDSLRLDLPDQAPSPARGDEASLFAQMLASPDDDAIRLVLADVYAERGDIRAELIQLQIANARAEKPLVKNVKRVEQILKKHLIELLGPIEPIVDKNNVVFSRGFLSHAEVRTKTAAQRELLGHPLLATLESMVTREAAIVRAVRAPHVSGLPWSSFVELAHGRPVSHVRSVRVHANEPNQPPLERLSGLPSLESFTGEMFGASAQTASWSWLLDGPLGPFGIDLELPAHGARLLNVLEVLDARPQVQRLSVIPRHFRLSPEDLRVGIRRTDRGYHLTLEGANYDSVLLGQIFSGLHREDLTVEAISPPAGTLTWFEPRLGERFAVADK
ncbi:MAG: TIGR02996 domain-containing protein [Polyangiales bacterium]